MMAMMLPSAAPTVLLFARSAAHGNPDERRLPTDAFMVGYLIAWGLFSLGATIAQWQFDRLNLLGPMQMTLTNRWLTAAVLLLAGMYQRSEEHTSEHQSLLRISSSDFFLKKKKN